MKKLIFGLIAAAIGGIASDLTEKGLIALDERRTAKTAEGSDETEDETDDEIEEGE